ncbi:MAG TPA: hypothetical protein VKH64_04290 [Candidatus Binatia bacterium]|nr:hypothetical protein [Candidatus Binatia bacterium]
MPHKLIIFAVLYVFCFAFIWSCTRVVDHPEIATIPSDFALSAQYGPGWASGAAWTLTVNADGQAVQKTYSFKKKTTVEKSFQVTADQARTLVMSIKESRFYYLAAEYKGEITDLETFIISATMNNKSHRVLVYAMPGVDDQAAMKRFDSVWNEIRRILGHPPVEWLEKRSLF